MRRPLSWEFSVSGILSGIRHTARKIGHRVIILPPGGSSVRERETETVPRNPKIEARWTAPNIHQGCAPRISQWSRATITCMEPEGHSKTERRQCTLCLLGPPKPHLPQNHQLCHTSCGEHSMVRWRSRPQPAVRHDCFHLRDVFRFDQTTVPWDEGSGILLSAGYSPDQHEGKDSISRPRFQVPHSCRFCRFCQLTPT